MNYYTHRHKYNIVKMMWKKFWGESMRILWLLLHTLTCLTFSSYLTFFSFLLCQLQHCIPHSYTPQHLVCAMNTDCWRQHLLLEWSGVNSDWRVAFQYEHIMVIIIINSAGSQSEGHCLHLWNNLSNASCCPNISERHETKTKKIKPKLY